MTMLESIQMSPELETALSAVESQLASLGESLRSNDAAAIDHHATELHRALARAVDRFANAARAGSVPRSLRERLKLAGGQVAVQRESLARATAALDRAMDVLMPRESHQSVYTASRGGERGLGGVIQA